MSGVLEKYKHVVEILDIKQCKYMHYRTVANFIDHLSAISSETERSKCETSLLIYLDEVLLRAEELREGSCSTSLYVDFFYPLEAIYNRIGFKSIMPIKLACLLAITVDIVIGILFFKYPYPILTFLIFFYYYFFERGYYKAEKVSGMLY